MSSGLGHHPIDRLGVEWWEGLTRRLTYTMASGERKPRLRGCCAWVDCCQFLLFFGDLSSWTFAAVGFSHYCCTAVVNSPGGLTRPAIPNIPEIKLPNILRFTLGEGY